MKKNVIAEVSRVREIMGLSLLMEGANEYHIVIACIDDKKDAKSYYKIIKEKYYKADMLYNNKSKCYLVTIGPYGNKSKAEKALPVIQRMESRKYSGAWIYTSTVKKEVETKIDDEGDVGGKEFDKVIFSDSLDVNNMPTFDPTKESEIYSCKVEGCSQWVSDTLKKFQGNAWHAHRNGRNKYSTYENAGTKLIPDMVSLFNLVNKNPKEESQETEAKRISKSLVPDQGNFSNLEIDDIVGLFYEPSYNHTKAFFEGMTGYKKMGGEKAAADGPFMLNAKNNDVWTPEMLGQNIKFKGGNTLHKGQSAGINTHLGFVGAIVDGEPIIFHNIDKQVWATPLSKMDKNKTAIVWARGGGGGEGTTETTVEKGEKTISQKNTEFLKKGLNLLYKKGKEFFD